MKPGSKGTTKRKQWQWNPFKFFVFYWEMKNLKRDKLRHRPDAKTIGDRMRLVNNLTVNDYKAKQGSLIVR